MPAKLSVDLNCDMGESFGPWTMGDDRTMLDIVTSANIACGFHAGDPAIMTRTVEGAKAKGVAVGAHPGFADLQGFGRRPVHGLSAREIETIVAYQIGALQAVAAMAGHPVTHVKAHGALSNMAAADLETALAIARAIKGVSAQLIFVVMPLTALARAGEALGLRLAHEAYADRLYEDDGQLMSRRKPEAIIRDAETAAERALAMVTDQAIVTASGRRLPVTIDTLCVHGDTPGAADMARAIRRRLCETNVELRYYGERSASPQR